MTAIDSGPALPKLGSSHAPLRQVVTDTLRGAILANRYRPGERLVEDQLAAELGVSRNPVREALRVLETEGLVEISPRRGATVAQISEVEAREIVELRAALEGLCARLATRRCTPEQKSRIDGILRRGDAAAEREDVADLNRVHGEVHQFMAQAGHNRHLTAFVQSLRDKTYWLYASSLTWRARLSWQEHATILRAVAGGDEDLAAILASRHVLNVGLAYVGKSGELTETEAEALPQMDGAPFPR